MSSVTRNIDPAGALDLLERVPRACLSLATEFGPQALPVVFLWRDERYLIGLPMDATALPFDGQEAVLLIDEGIYYFDLRAIYVRGSLQPVIIPLGAPEDSVWFELLAGKIVAWDYGSMREIEDES